MSLIKEVPRPTHKEISPRGQEPQKKLDQNGDCHQGKESVTKKNGRCHQGQTGVWGEEMASRLSIWTSLVDFHTTSWQWSFSQGCLPTAQPRKWPRCLLSTPLLPSFFSWPRILMHVLTSMRLKAAQFLLSCGVTDLSRSWTRSLHEHHPSLPPPSSPQEIVCGDHT